MLLRARRLAVIFGLLPVAAAANSNLIQVTAVRSWSFPEVTRIVLEMTGPFDFKADRAQNPDRLFFDILNARPWIAHKRIATHEVGDHLVQRIRVAETAPGTTRVVFDLAAPARFRVTHLDTPDRMVIEIRPLSESTPTEFTRVESANPQAGEITRETIRHRRRFLYPALPALTHAQIQIQPAPVLNFLPQIPALALLLPPFPRPVMLPARTQPAQVSVPESAALESAISVAAIAPAASLASVGTESENASRSLTRALGLKVNRIVIDAGHGGHDEGTIGPHGVVEKDVVLDVALRLSKLIQDRMSADVVLTRSDDTFIPLRERTNIANTRKADLFLSIHANSSPAREVGGTETFFLNFTSSPSALDVAARENAGSDRNVGDLKDLIQSITLNDKIEESHTFAQAVQNTIQSLAARSNPNAHNRGVKRAPFVVLIGAGMPSILAEIGFLSNAKDESNLGKPEYRQKVAEAIYKGLAQYAFSLSHFEAPRQVAAKQVASK